MKVEGKSFVLRGNICYSTALDHLEVVEGGFLVSEGGISKGVYRVLPERYEGLPLRDYGDRLILPGLVDLHIHAPQYAFRGLGMDMELLEWLNVHTFLEEGKYADMEYARKAYEIFAQDLLGGYTTRACVFGTIHNPATVLLMELLEATGLKTMVGKVNMDQNAPGYLCEDSMESLERTRQWLREIRGRFQHTEPILTPRFIPSCSEALLEGLQNIQRETKLPVQSHLSENPEEVAWVGELCPAAAFYGDAYDQFGLFGGACKTIMAHCVHSVPEEIQRMEERGVYVAHCPSSNANLASGIAPVREFLDRSMHVGLGSDVAGGHTASLFGVMAEAIQVSKLRWRLCDGSLAPLRTEEAFYLGTKGGGAFFGKVGSFEPGYEVDALILDDKKLACPRSLSVRERLERAIYLPDQLEVLEKYVAGVRVIRRKMDGNR